MSEARKRRAINRQMIEQWEREVSEPCAACGLARINVSHNIDPEDQIEGPDYYTTVTDLHRFVPKRALNRPTLQDSLSDTEG